MKKPKDVNQYISIAGHCWNKGKLIGEGGMSRIYTAQCDDVPGEFVIKIGNLFTELRIYTRLCQKSALEKAGMVYLPEYIDGGVNNETDEQFLILKRYKSSFPEGETISDRSFIRIIGNMLKALRYLHLNGFVHNDVKPENILYDGANFVLCDFGVTMKWKKTGYKDYTAKHFCGTKIFTGLDMHLPDKGPSPRSDIDSLIFTMIRWSGIKLPWSKLKSLDTIYAFKLDFLKNPQYLLTSCQSQIKRGLICAFIYLNSFSSYDELPLYNKFEDELNKYLNLIPEACCQKCDSLEHIRDQLMLSDDDYDREVIKMLKYIELW